MTVARVAIVTGATSGIGEATARKLCAAGYGVVGNGRNRDRLAVLEREIGHGFCPVQGDAADHTVLEQLFAMAKTHFGAPADAVIANAGRGLGGSVKDADLAEFDKVVRINLTGTLALLQKAARRMLEEAGDYPNSARDIVVIGSVVGREISPFSAAYGSTKFAVHALAEGLRREVAPKGIRVALVEPGIVRSGFQAAAGYSETMVEGFEERFGPLLVSEDIAKAIHFILEQPPHVNISDIVVRPTRQDYP